jgi:acetyl esterase/lipase
MKRTIMSRWITPCLVLAATLSTAPLAADQDARTILEKAIRAYGGEAKLARLKNLSSKAKGTVNLGSEVPFTQEIAWQWPDRLRNSVTLKSDKPIALIETIVGDDGWSVRDGKPGPLGAVKRDELRTQAHIRRLLLLTPLLQDKAYELSVLDEIRVNDRPAVGVRVSSTGERDVKLYFDADTGRLAKIERRVSDDAGKKESVQEEILSDYQEIDGVPTAMKQVWRRDGKKALEMTFTEVRYPDHLDADVFADPRPFTRRRDVIYGHKSGVALTMDVFTPKKEANGAAILALVSGGWFSDQATIESPTFSYIIDESVKRGYTVFAVCHGSQPRFTVPEAIADVNRAVRYVRYHARDFGIDPDRIGVTGGSAGGHLSLMLGVAGDRGNRRATDAVERTSSRVQAVACFFPPTDFLNYGEKGKVAFTEDGVLANFRTAIDVREFDKRTKRLEHLDDKDKLEKLYRQVSPLAHVSSTAPPTLIIHGDADKLVPIQQAEVMVEKLKKAGVPAELVVKKGAAHGWAGMDKDMATIVDWFDKYLKAAKSLPADDSPPEGFRSLFDGKTLKGWKAMPRPQGAKAAGGKKDKASDPERESFYEKSLKSRGKWTVQDGVLIGEQDPPGSGLGGYLVSEEAFGDFELLIDAKPDWSVDTGVLVRTTPGGNVGHQILIDHRRSGGIGGFYGNGLGNFHALAFTVDAVLDAGKPVGLKVEDPRTSLVPVTEDKRRLLSYAATPEQFLKAWKFGQWNTFRIRCTGDLPHLTTWINGVKIAELDTDKTELPNFDKKAVLERLGRKGHISLEVHSNGPNDRLGKDRWAPGAVCRWRRIYIKELRK